MKKIIKTTATAMSIVALLLIGVLIYYTCTLPDTFYVSDGTSFSISSDSLLECVSINQGSETEVMKSISLNSASSIKLMGIFPIKTVQLQNQPKQYLVPGGSPFGIKLLTEGVMVVGLSEINTPYGLSCPAKDAGFQLGDIITTINSEPALENGSVSKFIENSDGKSLEFEISRNGEKKTLTLTPVFCTDTNSYKSGIWVRDSTAGIGTVTYYNPDTGAFAGLGHAVCDIDTGTILPILSGDVGPVSISGVIKGYSGTPGELIGNFTSNDTVGTILYNTDAGVFGTLNSAPTDFEKIPIAYKQEIEVGPATIYSTIEGDLPKEYEILIEKIDLDSNSLTKNMVIRVVDEKLLSASGGIVQGMSGSPIIQNGKLIGAVTHVFVNNPTLGYGIFCENMIDSSESIANKAA